MAKVDLMPAAKNDINLNTVLLIGAGIIVYPILKGLLSAANVVSDVLSVPGDIATELNRQFNQEADRLAYEVMYNHVLLYDFDPNNATDVAELAKLKSANWLTAGQKQTLINVWKMPALPKMVLKGATNAVIQVRIYQALRDLRKLF